MSAPAPSSQGLATGTGSDAPHRVITSALELSDVDQISLLFPGWDMRFVQLGRGPFRAQIAFVGLEDLECKWARLNQTVQGRGFSARPGYSFAPVHEGNREWRRRSRKCCSGEVEINGPNDPMDDVANQDSDSELLRVDPLTLLDAIQVMTRKDPETLLRNRFALRPDATAFALFRAAIQRTLKLAEGGAGHLLDRNLAETVKSRVLTALALVLESSDPEEPEHIICYSDRQAVAREADEFMEEDPSRPLTTLQLCRRLSVSRRTVFYAFQDAFGLAPMTYYRLKRLNRVRRDLKKQDPETTTVAEVARKWGFRHSGQFAKDYSELFGERPSLTLATRFRTLG